MVQQLASLRVAFDDLSLNRTDLTQLDVCVCTYVVWWGCRDSTYGRGKGIRTEAMLLIGRIKVNCGCVTVEMRAIAVAVVTGANCVVTDLPFPDNPSAPPSSEDA